MTKYIIYKAIKSQVLHPKQKNKNTKTLKENYQHPQNAKSPKHSSSKNQHRQ